MKHDLPERGSELGSSGGCTAGADAPACRDQDRAPSQQTTATLSDRGDRGLSHPTVSSPKLYGSEFWLVYLANFLLTAANALTFRFAEFVDFLNGTAATVGLIVGIGIQE